ncbi:SHOCT domain-containing protein [Thermaerobacter composti]|uniref:SHOCT domain-containing protein n=1 Tax=Thermaerobacter composti TaxID=554949 RepID=A0ABZ0QS22_9FIRM|nr:SHOCT domain-containing protein [Thermaerobacter composti]WPD20166.1 SHOCT domain-containing protein [Thermaerobacter composti]
MASTSGPGFLQKVGKYLKDLEEEGRRRQAEHERKKREREEEERRKQEEREKAAIAALGIDPEGAFRAVGANGELVVTPKKVVIVRRGILQGHRGNKEIAIKSITAVQLKRAGTVFSGYLQIAYSGSTESKSYSIFDAAKDENTVMFTKDQEEAFLRAKELIEQYREQAAPMPHPTATTSTADELAKLADLVERGFLTRDEFEAKKKQLLGP